MNDLNKLSKDIYEGNKLRGFDVSKENIGQSLMLVVSELAEALEADRKERYYSPNFDIENNTENFNINNHSDVIYFCREFEKSVKDTFEDEIADSFIRLFDLVGGLGIDIEKHIELKLKYNSTRPFRHGKKY